MLICPPATLIRQVHDRAIGSALLIGAQACQRALNGAHTGDLSVSMLADAGVTHVIVVHSERRADHGETDALIQAKATAVTDRGMIAIVCVGETEAERDADRTLEVVGAQLRGSLPTGSVAAHVVVAYEPVWAIGTSRTSTLDQIRKIQASWKQRGSDRLNDRFGKKSASVICAALPNERRCTCEVFLHEQLPRQQKAAVSRTL